MDEWKLQVIKNSPVILVVFFVKFPVFSGILLPNKTEQVVVREFAHRLPSSSVFFAWVWSVLLEPICNRLVAWPLQIARAGHLYSVAQPYPIPYSQNHNYYLLYKVYLETLCSWLPQVERLIQDGWAAGIYHSALCNQESILSSLHLIVLLYQKPLDKTFQADARCHDTTCWFEKVFQQRFWKINANG